ncbi:MAG: antibiotic biosynthesis monooxygenase [Chitinispirillia bacterium]|jgi:autoinducer 2-degrading protein
MIVTTIHVKVKDEFIEGFVEATIKNHRESIKEPGNIRFDVLQVADDPSMFTLYEAFESKDAVMAHKETAHYKEWRQSVDHMMAVPRKGVVHSVIAPEPGSQW